MPLSWLWVRKGHGSKTTTEHPTCSAGPSAQGGITVESVWSAQCGSRNRTVDDTLWAVLNVDWDAYRPFSFSSVPIHVWGGRPCCSLVPNILEDFVEWIESDPTHQATANSITVRRMSPRKWLTRKGNAALSMEPRECFGSRLLLAAATDWQKDLVGKAVRNPSRRGVAREIARTGYRVGD